MSYNNARFTLNFNIQCEKNKNWVIIMYNEINFDAKNYLLKELLHIFNEKYDDKNLLDRCYKELNILYENNVLFIIEYLYKYKNENKDTKYFFKGMINNLFILYVLGLNDVDQVKYNLSYELYFDETINVSLINQSALEFVEYLSRYGKDFQIIKGKTDRDIHDNDTYLLIPATYEDSNMLLKFNNDGVLETVEDYHQYSLTYLTIKIDEKPLLLDSDKVSLKNVITTPDDIKIASILNPKTLDDYIKVKSIAHSVRCFKNNQDKLIRENKIDINTLITSRDDIYDYLINHSINKFIAVDIVKSLCRHKDFNSYLWGKYFQLMRENGCEEIFIEIITKLISIHGRGEAVSECLKYLDKNNIKEVA